MAIIEWKPVTSQVDSVADYYNGALTASLAAQQAFKDTGDTLKKAYTDTQKGNLMRDLISGYDPNDLQSYNKALKLAGSTYYGIDPEIWERLNGDYRTTMNKQLDADNLNINKQLMAEAQARVNLAEANADIAGLKAANKEAATMLDANGNAVRTDAYTLGEVDPLLNSASQRALQAAKTQELRRKAKEELDTKNFDNYVASSSQNIAMQIPLSLYGTPEGAQMAMDLAMQAASKAEGITNKTALIPAIAENVIKKVQWLQGQGIDTTLFGTPADTFSYQIWDEYGNTKTITVDPRYADSTLNRAAAVIKREAEEEAISAERDQKILQAMQDTVDSVSTNLAEGKIKEAQYALDTINGDDAYSDEQKALVNDQWKLYQLNQQIAAATQAPPPQNELGVGTVAMIQAGLGPNYNPLRSLAGTTMAPQNTQLQAMRADREKLAQAIKERQEVMKKEQENDRFVEIVKANDYSPKAQVELKQHVDNAVADANDANATALSAVGSMLDKDGVQVGNSSLVPNIAAVMTLKNGKVPDDMGALTTITGSDGKPLSKEQSSMLEGREVAELISKETTNMRGNRQLTTSELNEIQQDFNRIKRQIADTMQASNNFGGNAVDAQAIAASMAYDIIKAGIERSSGLAALYDDYDYHSDDANAALQATLNVLSGKDSQVQQVFDNAARNNMYAKKLLDDFAKYNEKAKRAYALSIDMKKRNTMQKALGQTADISEVPVLLNGMSMGATAAPMSRSYQNLKGQ